MTAIQIVLVAAGLLFLLRVLRGPFGGALSRLLAVVAGVAGIVLVLVPDLSSRLAHLLGVTRGVDLVLYLSIVALGFLWLHQTARLERLEQQLAHLVRSLAIRDLTKEEERAGERDDGDRSRD